MNLELAGRVVVVLGAASGIGRAIAQSALWRWIGRPL